MEQPDLIADARFAKLADRAARNDEINGIVAAWTATLDATEIEKRCVASDVPVATAYTAADIFADPHMDARHDLVTVEDPVIGAVRQQAPFPRVAGATPAAPAGAPRLGAHTREVLGALGVDGRRARRPARERDRVTKAFTAVQDGLFELHDDGTLDLVGGYSPTSDRFHFPLLPDVSVQRRGRRAAGAAVAATERSGRGPR